MDLLKYDNVESVEVRFLSWKISTKVLRSF